MLHNNTPQRGKTRTKAPDITCQQLSRAAPINKHTCVHDSSGCPHRELGSKAARVFLGARHPVPWPVTSFNSINSHKICHKCWRQRPKEGGGTTTQGANCQLNPINAQCCQPTQLVSTVCRCSHNIDSGVVYMHVPYGKCRQPCWHCPSCS